MVSGTYLNLLESDLVVSDDADVSSHLLEELVQVVCERVVVVDHQSKLSVGEAVEKRGGQLEAKGR